MVVIQIFVFDVTFDAWQKEESFLSVGENRIKKYFPLYLEPACLTLVDSNRDQEFHSQSWLFKLTVAKVMSML